MGQFVGAKFNKFYFFSFLYYFMKVRNRRTWLEKLQFLTLM